jgi:hypothetical protein
LKANFQLHTRTDKHLQRVQLVSWLWIVDCGYPIFFPSIKFPSFPISEFNHLFLPPMYLIAVKRHGEGQKRTRHSQPAAK